MGGSGGRLGGGACGTEQTKRDLALDALRGLFIIVLTLDHMAGLVVRVTWQTFGFVSVLPGFLFISGYIVALAYGSAIRRRGLAVGLRKILARMGQIYLWHVASVIAVVGGTIVLIQAGAPIESRMATVETLLALARLETLNVYFNIIPLYLFLLAWAAVILTFLRRRPGTIALVGLAVWALADIIPAPLHPWADTALLQPLPWQVVFTLGLAVGLARDQGRPLAPPRWAMVGAVILAVLFFLLRWDVIDPGSGVLGALEGMLFDRDRLGPARLLNIVVLVLLVSWLLGPLRPWLSRRATLVMVGQNSLVAFSLQIVIVYALGLIRHGGAFWPPGTLWVLLTETPSPPVILYVLSFDILSVLLVILSTHWVVRGLTSARGRMLGWRGRAAAGP